MGDFNVVLKGEDQINRNQIADVEVRDFEQCILSSGLTELRSIGRFSTWTNNHVHSKIDRVTR